VEGDVPECFEYSVGVRSRWLAGDVRHLLAVLRGRPRGWTDRFPSRWETVRDLLNVSDRDVHYDELWRSDPFPVVGEVLDLLLRQAPRFFTRRPRSVVQEKSRNELAESVK
jgi:hypothetical protein